MSLYEHYVYIVNNIAWIHNLLAFFLNWQALSVWRLFVCDSNFGETFRLFVASWFREPFASDWLDLVNLAEHWNIFIFFLWLPIPLFFKKKERKRRISLSIPPSANKLQKQRQLRVIKKMHCWKPVENVNILRNYIFTPLRALGAKRN